MQLIHHTSVELELDTRVNMYIMIVQHLTRNDLHANEDERKSKTKEKIKS